MGSWLNSKMAPFLGPKMLSFGLKCILCYFIVLYGIVLYFIVLHCILWYITPLHGIACYCVVGFDAQAVFRKRPIYLIYEYVFNKFPDHLVPAKFPDHLEGFQMIWKFLGHVKIFQTILLVFSPPGMFPVHLMVNFIGTCKNFSDAQCRYALEWWVTYSMTVTLEFWKKGNLTICDMRSVSHSSHVFFFPFISSS